MSCNHVYVDDDGGTADGYDEPHRAVTTTSARNSHRQQTSKQKKEWKDTNSDSLLFLFTVVWDFLKLSSGAANMDAEPAKKKTKMSPPTWDDCADDILDGAGSFLCSPPRLMWSMVFGGQQPRVMMNPCWNNKNGAKSNTNQFTEGLAPDLHVQILSFLHPKDVVTFACASKEARVIVDHGQTSLNLWGALWKRDYAWLIESWSIGRAAFLERSAVVEPTTTKDFYFRFGLSYTNYILAGHNTPQSCFVSIHGSIYDLTPFLDQHPGTPDTILVQSGKDVTKHFDDIGHSSSARKYARTLCVAVDNFAHRNSEEESGCACGVQPTSNATFVTEKASSSRVEFTEPTNIPFLRRRRQKKKKPSTLHSVLKTFQEEEGRYQMTAERTHANNTKVLSHINVFYDPFTRQWQLWYTDTDFKTVFARL